MFTKRFLKGVVRKAVRNGVWYSALDGLDRGILVLAGRVVDAVRSVKLSIEIVKILAKLRRALRGGFVRHMESYGLRMARLISARAASFGYDLAEGWAHDLGFVRYLTFMDLNRPTGWGTT